MLKGLAALLLIVFAGGWFAGAFGPAAYSRTVGRPPAAVMAALEHLDITAQPGAPGSTAAAAGGIKPMFRLARNADTMTWYVMSGDKVATAMTAQFEAVDGGKATRIRTKVERGDAPDDFVSPAFRSKGLTMALFGMAIEGEVNKLVAPPAAPAVDCSKLVEQMTEQNMVALPPGGHPQGFLQGMGEASKAIMRVNAMDAELRRHGCPTDGNSGAFHPVESHMADDQPMAMPSAGPTPVPGKPMLDPTPSR